MRILVLGRSGQLARSLAAVGQAFGHAVTPMGRSEADLCDPAAIRAAIAASQSDIVVNAAAYTMVDRAESDHGAARRLNVEGPAAASSAAHDKGVPFIHISTDYVFDGLKGRPYVETDATAPLNVYGATKAEGEVAVALANPRHVVLRTSWIYSTTPSNFVLTMLRLAAERDHLKIVDDQTGRPTSADDLAQAILHLAVGVVGADAGDPRFGLFHCAASGEATWCDFAEAIMAKSRSRGGPWCAVEPISTDAYPTPARRPRDTRLDCGRLQLVHDIRLPDWRGSLGRCLDQILESTSLERRS